MELEVLLSLLILSTCVLLTMMAVSLQQLCITDVTDRQRCSRTCSTSFFAVLSVCLNGLAYVAAQYPHYVAIFGLDMAEICNAFEAFVIIVGFHLFRKFELVIIDQMYLPLNKYPPKYLNTGLIIHEIVIFFTVLTCYALRYIYPEIDFIHIFYAILGVTIIVQALCILTILHRVLTLLNSYRSSDIIYTEMQNARNAIKFSILVVIIVIFVSIADIVISFQDVYNYMNITMNEALCDSIMHTLILFIISGALILGIYKKSKCCQISENSVCIVWCCGDFCVYYCSCCCHGKDFYYVDNTKDKNNDKKAILLDVSTRTHQDTNHNINIIQTPVSYPKDLSNIDSSIQASAHPLIVKSVSENVKA